MVTPSEALPDPPPVRLDRSARPVDGAPRSASSPVGSLDDRLAFRRAQAVLAGLTGSTQAAAARSLRAVAAQLDRPAPEVAALFLDALEAPEDERAVALVQLITAGGGPGETAAAGAGPPDRSPGAALETLFDHCAGSCLAVALQLLGDDDRAEHAVESAFLDAWEHLAAGEPVPAPPDRWLRQRTHRHAVTRLRADRDRLTTEVPALVGRDLPGALPPEQRRAVQWAVWGGCTLQDIARLTGSPLAVVRGDLLAGVRALGRSGGSQRTGQPG